MKKLMVILMILMLTAILVADQTSKTPQVIVQTERIEKDLEDVDIRIEEAMKRVEKALENLPEDRTMQFDFRIQRATPSSDTPKLGIYTTELNFERAYRMRYDYNYGVMIRSVASGGAADRAGLLADDIIMQIDGEKVLYKDHLPRLMATKSHGDTLELKIFRDEKIIDVNVYLPYPEDDPEDPTIKKVEVEKKRKLSAGYGGGSWIPVWYMGDLADVNDMISRLGFSELNEDGLFLNGGGGKGTIGKNWFIGGMGTGYSLDRKTGITLDDGKNVTRRMNYRINYGGVTLDKRFPVSNKIVTSLGFMLGWGGHSLEVSQTDGNYDWNSMEDDLENSYNNAIEMERRYIMFQPKAAAMYRLTGWLGVRAEVGYILSHSYHSGWNAVSCNDTFEIVNSPDTSFDGLTITIGPWFGF